MGKRSITPKTSNSSIIKTSSIEIDEEERQGSFPSLEEPSENESNLLFRLPEISEEGF